MFDPFKAQKDSQTRLSNSQGQFISKYFTTFMKDEMVRDHILKSSPVPSHSDLVVPERDPQMLDIVGPKFNQVKAMDQSLSRVHKRLLNVMGPLGALWK